MDNKTLLQQLKAKIKELNNMLRFKIDNSMKVMQMKNPDFYLQYKNSRRNYSLGERHGQPEEMTAVQSKEAAEPLSAVLNDIQVASTNGLAA